LKPRQKRIALIVSGLATVSIATVLVMNALNSNIAFFVTPTEVVEGKAPQNKAFRIGGMVKEGSIRRDNLTVHFTITDTAKEVPVLYTGILPDLFKEGKGAVAQGRINPDGTFAATEVLAKHDENYMPPEAQHAIDKANKI
jgi:cytochrome c-type biogenesis protein CcmE